MAAPHVAGVAALYKDVFGNESQATINAWLDSKAGNGKIGGNLRGTPNVLLNKENL